MKKAGRLEDKMQVSGRFRCVGLAAVASAAVFACAHPASGVLIAEWNFNPSYTAGTFSVSADSGTGTLTIDGTWAAADLLDVGGTLVNDLSGSAGGALKLKNQAHNGLGIEFAISTVGLQDLMLSFATLRNNSGFNSNTVTYSPDGGTTFFAITGAIGTSPYDPGTVYATQTFDFSTIVGLDNNAAVVIRIVFSGASGGGTNQFNNIDNVQFNAVPEPGSLALLGIAALVGLRRRRRQA